MLVVQEISKYVFADVGDVCGCLVVEQLEVVVTMDSPYPEHKQVTIVSIDMYLQILVLMIRFDDYKDDVKKVDGQPLGMFLEEITQQQSCNNLAFVIVLISTALGNPFETV